MGRMGADHFLEMGHRDVTFIGLPNKHYETVRIEGFRSRVEERGVTVHPGPDVKRIFRKPLFDQLNEIQVWLNDLPRPLGVFGTHDEMAHLVLEACHAGQIAVPESVAVLGVNNVQLCRLSNPGLSSVSPDGRRRGRFTAQMLHHLITCPGQTLPSPGPNILVEATPSDFPLWRIPPDGIRRRRSTAAFAVEDRGLRKALHFIQQETASGLTVNNVAANAGASRRTLERRFQQALGRSIYDEIRRQRLEKACRLLSETRLGTMEIALESGFQTASDLANAFRKYIGLRPGEYRERFR